MQQSKNKITREEFDGLFNGNSQKRKAVKDRYNIPH
jgi:hypothetical protein